MSTVTAVQFLRQTIEDIKTNYNESIFNSIVSTGNGTGTAFTECLEVYWAPYQVYELQLDENGNLVFDENGNPIFVMVDITFPDVNTFSAVLNDMLAKILVDNWSQNSITL